MLQMLHSNLKALGNIKHPTDQWDELLIHLIATKFDQNTIVTWESTLSGEIPNMGIDVPIFNTEMSDVGGIWN